MPKFTTSDNLNLYYTDEGNGLPILCLAGLSRNGSDFDYVAPHLTDHRLIRLDYRGRGQSDWDANWNNYILPIECRDVIELLDHLKLDAAAIIGTSRGGLNAMGIAAMAPDRLLGVALNDIGYTGPLSIEWEDIRMDRIHGATESCAFTRELDFAPSDVAFDAAFDKDEQ